MVFSDGFSRVFVMWRAPLLPSLLPLIRQEFSMHTACRNKCQVNAKAIKCRSWNAWRQVWRQVMDGACVSLEPAIVSGQDLRGADVLCDRWRPSNVCLQSSPDAGHCTTLPGQLYSSGCGSPGESWATSDPWTWPHLKSWQWIYWYHYNM